MHELNNKHLVERLHEQLKTLLGDTEQDPRNKVSYIGVAGLTHEDGRYRETATQSDLFQQPRAELSREVTDPADATKYILEVPVMMLGAVARHCIWFAPGGGYNGYRMTMKDRDTQDLSVLMHGGRNTEDKRQTFYHARYAAEVSGTGVKDTVRYPHIPRRSLEVFYEELTELGPGGSLREFDVVVAALPASHEADFDAFLRDLQPPS